jgi:FkbM family methyltransferase
MRANAVLRAGTMSGLRIAPLPPATKWHFARYLSGRLESPDSPRVKATMREGFRMLLDLGESYERTMCYSGLYNPWLTKVFRQLLRPGDTVVDGGANIGYFTLLAGKRTGSAGSVHAFEPIPTTYQALLDNVQLNGLSQVHPNCLALGREESDLRFDLPADTQTGRPLGRLATAVVHKSAVQVSARSITLDAYAAAAGIARVRLVKLDVEGSEIAAIEGMRQLLSERRIDYLVCELNTYLFDASGIPRSAMRDHLSASGYRAYYLHATGGYKRPARVHLVPVSQMPQPDIYGDYLFAAPETELPPGLAPAATAGRQR